MVKVATFFAMSVGAFAFWQTMDKIHVWIALHQDEKEDAYRKESPLTGLWSQQYYMHMPETLNLEENLAMFLLYIPDAWKELKILLLVANYIGLIEQDISFSVSQSVFSDKRPNEWQERMEKEAEIRRMRAELIRENKERESLA
ncbi:hypothetical protein H5410_026335 [Solanum commersonii]|uniref:Uncharacterized protein n=1 Tax=Solanum commersonii TaxID=4109 RepID=A0A9J5YVT6_SOLCO|nr:hypothetical protein H5410_026335 [Solanum commersonii]